MSETIILRNVKFSYEGAEDAVIGVPLGAETAGSLMALSGRGRALAKPERSATAPTKGAMKTIIE